MCRVVALTTQSNIIKWWTWWATYWCYTLCTIPCITIRADTITVTIWEWWWCTVWYALSIWFTVSWIADVIRSILWWVAVWWGWDAEETRVIEVLFRVIAFTECFVTVSEWSTTAWLAYSAISSMSFFAETFFSVAIPVLVHTTCLHTAGA